MTLSATQTFAVTVVIMGVGVFVLMVCGAFIGYAAAQLEPGGSRIARRQLYLLALIALWFAAALATSTVGLISFGLVLPFVLLPIIGGTLLSCTPPLRALIRAIPTHWLVLLQVYRVAGGVFIFPYLTEGVLTRGFALSAGVGDVITGVVALPVAGVSYRRAVQGGFLRLDRVRHPRPCGRARVGSVLRVRRGGCAAGVSCHDHPALFRPAVRHLDPPHHGEELLPETPRCPVRNVRLETLSCFVSAIARVRVCVAQLTHEASAKYR